MARIWKEHWWWIIAVIAGAIIMIIGIVTDVQQSPAQASDKPNMAEFMRLARLYSNKPRGAFKFTLSDVDSGVGMFEVNVKFEKKETWRLILTFEEFVPRFEINARGRSVPVGFLAEVPVAFVDNGPDGEFDAYVPLYTEASIAFKVMWSREHLQSYYEGIVAGLIKHLRKKVAET